MAIYTVEDITTGQVFKIEGPEGASDFELQQFMSTQFQEEEEEPVDDDIGLGREIIHGMTRAGVRIITAPKQYVAEELAQISDLKRDRLAREAEGDVSALSRLNTGLSRNNETPEQLDRQAAGYLQSRAQSLAAVDRGAPTSQRGIEGVELFTDVDKDKGFFGQIGQGLSQVASDPLKAGRGLVAVTSEQIPTIAAGGAVSLITKSPTAGIGVMTASSYQQERFGQLASTAQEYGYDLTNRGQALAAIKDKTFMAEQKRRGYTRGAIIATIDAATLGIAAKTPLSLLGVGKNTGIQAGAGGLGEAAGGYAATGEVDAGEVLVETFAEGVTAPLDVAALGLRNRKAKKDKNAAGGSDLFSEADTAELEANADNSETSAKDIADVANEQLELDLNDPNGEIATQQRAAAQAEQQAAEEKAQRLAQLDAQREAAKTFSKKDYIKQRNTLLEADAVNPNTPAGSAFKERIDTLELIDETDIKAELKKFVGEQKPTDEEVTTGHKEELNKRIALAQQNEGQRELDLGDVAQDTTTKTEKPPVDKAAKPESAKVAAARAYAEEQLGPDWETIGGLSQEFTSRKGFYKADKTGKTGWQKSVDAEVAAQNPVAEVTVAEAAATPVNVSTTDAPKGLSKDQQKIFDVLVDHFVGDKKFEIDNVYAAGQFLTENIAELAGVKSRQAVSTTINRFKTKILEDQGVIKKNAKKADKDAAVKQFADSLAAQSKANRTATVADDALSDTESAEATVDQTPDSFEVSDDEGAANNSIFQQQGMGTVASVGQGAYTGSDISPEDIAFTKARSEEPDTYENKRQEIADKTRAQSNKTLIQDYGQEAIAEWRNTVSDGAIDVRDLNKTDLLEWISVVGENREGQITDAQMREDQREIEKRYGTEKAENNIEGPSAGAITSTESGNQNEQVRTEDTGSAQEGNPDNFTAGEAKAPVVEKKKKRKITKPRFGIGSKIIEPDFDQVEKEQAFAEALVDLTGNRDNWKVKIYDNIAQFAAARIKGEITGFEDSSIPAGAYAFTKDDKSGVPNTYIILDRVPAGSERAVLMHEVGGHMGLDNVLSLDEQANVADQIRAWAAKSDNSLESIVSNRVMDRLDKAAEVVPEVATLNELKNSETVAYFLEEATFAGIEPTVKSPLGRLVRKLYAMFKKALRKISMAPETLTPKDIVDLGWGAARFSLSTRKHGTSANFTRFDHSRMGSGEGNQAYGFGSYLAERFGIARWYLRTDEARKSEARQAYPSEFGIKGLKPVGFAEVSKELQNRIKNPAPDHPPLSKYLALDVFDAPEPPSMLGSLSLRSLSLHSGNDDVVIVTYLTENDKTRTYPVDNILAPEERSGALADELAGIKQKLIEDRKRFDAEATVEGSLMHVDTTVSDTELLPWSDPVGFPVSGGYVVRDALTKLLNRIDPKITLQILIGAGEVMGGKHHGYRQEIESWFNTNGYGEINRTIVETLDDATGQAIYASMYAYDKRNKNALVPYLSEETLQRPEFVTVENLDFNFDPPLELHRSDKVVSMLLDEAGIKGIIYPDAGTLGSKDTSKGMANNVVIFNDKNLFVVGRTAGSNVGNKKNKVSEIRFGINEDWVKSTHGGETSLQVYREGKEIATKAANSVKFLHQVIRDVKDIMPSLDNWMQSMLKVEATRTEIRQSFEKIALRTRDLAPDRLAQVNDFLAKSTYFQKWGYDPKIKDKKVKVDPIMSKAFARLNAEDQKLVKDVFAHSETMRQRKIAIAKKFGVEGKFFTDAALEGPYAPLKRFGEYVTELKSQAMADAETANAAEGATKADKERYKKLSQDPEHYVISFFDTIGAAQKFEDANKSKFAFTSSTGKAPDFRDGRLANPQVFEKVLGALKADSNAQIDGQAKQAFEKLVKDLYFQSLDERSARLSGSKRLNRAGYEKNMMRSFLSHARSEANLVAQMENGADINAAFAEAGRQTKTKTGEVRDKKKQDAYNLVAKHYMMSLSGKPTPIMDRLATANSVYTLLTSVGYHVTNMTQPVMVTVPRVAGDFADYSGAWDGLIKGYGMAAKGGMVRMDRYMEVNVDVNKAPPEYQRLFKKMDLYQLLSVGMEEDLSFFEKFDSDIDILNNAGDFLGKTTHKLYQVSRMVEAVNRISSAVSAYDQARKNPAKLREMKMTAEEYAIAVVQDTQGDFSSLDAPLLIKHMNDSGLKLAAQYRKYQLLMAWHYTDAYQKIRQNESAESRAAGKRIMKYSLYHAMLGAGAVGLPLVSTGFWLATFLGDEDEPDDLERWIKRNVDDGLFGDVLSRGVLSTLGIDFSAKLSQAKIFHPLPYVDFKTGDAGLKDIAFNMFAGSAGTTAANGFRAHEYFMQGDTMKALEYSVPKGIRSLLESYRIATDGYSLKNGDIVADPREISGLSIFLNGLGIPAGDIQQLKWTRGQQYTLENYFGKESGKLRRQYIKAYKARDRSKMNDLRQEWRDLQKAKDRVRPFFNNARGVLRRQPVGNLLRAPRAQTKREKKNRDMFGN